MNPVGSLTIEPMYQYDSFVGLFICLINAGFALKMGSSMQVRVSPSSTRVSLAADAGWDVAVLAMLKTGANNRQIRKITLFIDGQG